MRERGDTRIPSCRASLIQSSWPGSHEGWLGQWVMNDPYVQPDELVVIAC
jgi:hypothetical protein